MPIEGIKQIIFAFYFLIEQKNDRIINGIKYQLFNQKIKRQIIKIHFAQNNLKIYLLDVIEISSKSFVKKE
jgi:hypothetical protein